MKKPAIDARPNRGQKLTRENKKRSENLVLAKRADKDPNFLSHQSTRRTRIKKDLTDLEKREGGMEKEIKGRNCWKMGRLRFAFRSDN